MSRGLGRVQRAVLAALRQAGGRADIRTLVVAVAYPAHRADPVAPDHLYDDYRERVTRDDTVYQSVLRAVRRLEQIGMVRTSWQRASCLALVNRQEAHWKEVYLTSHPTTAMMVVPVSWSCWAQEEGYQQQEVLRLTAAGEQVLEIWGRATTTYPYLVVLLGLTMDQGAVVLPCRSHLGMREMVRQVQTCLQHATIPLPCTGSTLVAHLQSVRQAT